MSHIFNKKEASNLPNINFKFSSNTIECNGLEYSINRLPGYCPYCRTKTHWQYVYSEETDKNLLFILRCADTNCKSISLFIYEKKIFCSYHNSDMTSYYYCLVSTYPEEIFLKTKFDKAIQKLSPNFIELYNQAETAELQSRTEKIAGIGYRKALEFLIKDYLISKNKDKEEEIKNPKLTLGNAINTYCKNEDLKELFKLSVYLGNDEAHYIKIWEEYDINNLKELINISVRKIEDKIITDDYQKRMGANK